MINMCAPANLWSWGVQLHFLTVCRGLKDRGGEDGKTAGSALIVSLCKAQRPDEALAVYNSMLNYTLPADIAARRLGTPPLWPESVASSPSGLSSLPAIAEPTAIDHNIPGSSQDPGTNASVGTKETTLSDDDAQADASAVSRCENQSALSRVAAAEMLYRDLTDGKVDFQQQHRLEALRGSDVKSPSSRNEPVQSLHLDNEVSGAQNSSKGQQQDPGHQDLDNQHEQVNSDSAEVHSRLETGSTNSRGLMPATQQAGRDGKPKSSPTSSSSPTTAKQEEAWQRDDPKQPEADAYHEGLLRPRIRKQHSSGSSPTIPALHTSQCYPETPSIEQTSEGQMQGDSQWQSSQAVSLSQQEAGAQSQKGKRQDGHQEAGLLIPQPAAVAVLVAALACRGRLEEALQIFRLLQQDSRALTSTTFGVGRTMWQSLIEVACRRWRIDTAVEVREPQEATAVWVASRTNSMDGLGQ